MDASKKVFTLKYSINAVLTQRGAIVAESASKKGYRIDLPTPDDKQITTRGRWWRRVNLVVSSIAILGGPILLFWWWGSFIDFSISGALAGFGIGGYIASRLIPDRLLINNPEWTAYVTQNIFGGEMVAYGPGLHPAYWWEEHNKTGNYPLKLIRRPFSQSIATKTSKAMVSGQFEYAVSLPHVERAVGVSESTIEGGANSFIENFLTSKCAGKETEWVRTNIDKLNTLLSSDFSSTEVEELNLDGFKEKYGFVIVSIVINSIALPDAVQKTRDAADEAANTLKVVARLYGYGENVTALQEDIRGGKISSEAYTEMLEHAQAQSENVKMDVQVFRGTVPSAAASLAKGGRS